MNPRTTWSFYETATGRFTGRALAADTDDVLLANMPDRCAAIVGIYDPLRQRVNVQTGTVEDWESPQIAIEEREMEFETARRSLQALDLRALRALSDLAISPTDAQAQQRVLEIEALKEIQRAIIRGGTK